MNFVYHDNITFNMNFNEFMLELFYHRLFLIGLKICGNGDWKGISRQFLPSKSPTQISSHAQKYHLHQKGEKKNKKRKSIHEITLEGV